MSREDDVAPTLWHLDTPEQWAKLIKVYQEDTENKDNKEKVISLFTDLAQRTADPDCQFSSRVILVTRFCTEAVWNAKTFYFSVRANAQVITGLDRLADMGTITYCTEAGIASLSHHVHEPSQGPGEPKQKKVKRNFLSFEDHAMVELMCALATTNLNPFGNWKFVHPSTLEGCGNLLTMVYVVEE